MDIVIERNYQGMDIVAYLIAVCLTQGECDVAEDMWRDFENDQDGPSNA